MGRKCGLAPSPDGSSARPIAMIAKDFFLAKDIRRIGAKMLRDHGRAAGIEGAEVGGAGAGLRSLGWMMLPRRLRGLG